MHTIAVLGYNGYLGSHFVRGIERRGWNALGLSRSEINYSAFRLTLPTGPDGTGRISVDFLGIHGIHGFP